MQIDGAILRDYLDSFCFIPYCKVGNVRFSWVDLVGPKDELVPETLYVCSEEKYEAVIRRLESDKGNTDVISLLVVSEYGLEDEGGGVFDELQVTHESPSLPESEKVRVVIECKSSLTVFDLVKRLQDYVRKLTEWKLTMDNEMLCGGMHQAMLDLSEPILGNTVVVVDCDYNLLAYTAGSATAEGVLHSVVEKGRFDEAALSQMVEAKLITAGHVPVAGKSQRQTWARLDAHEVIVRPYFTKNTFSAYLIMACDGHKPTRGLECLFNILAEAIGHCVAKDVQQRLRPGSREERFVVSLLEDKQPAGNQLEQACREHGMPLVGSFRVCLFVVGESCSMGFAEREIRANVGRCWLSVRGNTIAAICVDDRVVDDEQLERDELLKKLLEENGIYLAVSNVYDDVADTGVAFRQARVAERYLGGIGTDGGSSAGKSHIVAFWKVAPLWAVAQDEYSDRYLLEHLAKDNSITKLVRGDKPNSISDIVVLYHYLRNNCDARVTSDVLYMHRNTVYYRMRRIEKELDVNIADPQAQSYLRFLFVLMKANGVTF